MLAAAARYFRAQPLTNDQGGAKYSRTQVNAAELFYLRHLRTCAASASGNRSTCSAAAQCVCTSGLLVVMDCIMSLVKEVLQDMLQPVKFLISMFLKVLRSTLQMLELVMSMLTAVFQSIPRRWRCALASLWWMATKAKIPFKLYLRSPLCSLHYAIGTCHGLFHTTTLYADSSRRFACKRYFLTRSH